MKTSSWRDVELLSAYLDGQLSPRQKARLEARLKQDAALRQTLAGLRQTRALLRRMPPRRVPRAFTLTAAMAGVRPPTPRPALALRWAAATALVLFFCSFLIPYPLSFLPMAGAPKIPATALILEAATEAPQEERSIAAAPTEEPLAAPAFPTETPEHDQSLRAFAPSPSTETGGEAPPSALGSGPGEMQSAPEKSIVLLSPFQLTLLALAMVMAGASLLLDRLRERAFRRRFAVRGPSPPKEQ